MSLRKVARGTSKEGSEVAGTISAQVPPVGPPTNAPLLTGGIPDASDAGVVGIVLPPRGTVLGLQRSSPSDGAAFGRAPRAGTSRPRGCSPGEDAPGLSD